MFDCKSCCSADESKEVVVGVSANTVPGVKSEMPIEEAANMKAEATAAEKKAEADRLAKEKAAKEKKEAEEKAAKEAAEKAAKLEKEKAEKKKAAEKEEREAAERRSAAEKEAKKKEEAKPKKVEFEITVSKKSSEPSGIGLDVDFQDPVKLQVEKVKSGLVEDWNKANPQKQVRCKDFILEVNKKCSTQEMINEVKNASTLTMKIRRESEMIIKMTKADATTPIGLDIDSATLTLMKVKDQGAVHAYNTSLDASMKEFEVKAGDTFVAVNGKTTVNEMVEQLKNQKELQITVQRS